MDEKSASQARVLGLTLEQYAGIQTALIEGFPLPDVLKNERLSLSRWSRVRAAWGDKLARDGHGGPLAAAFSRKSVEAARWLGRRVTPLDEDLHAWCAFLGAYSAEPAPASLLQRLGLRDVDVQRLVLLWKTRIDADAALAKGAAEIAATRPRSVPDVRVLPGKLRPFPWSPGPEQARAAPAVPPLPEVTPGAPANVPAPATPALEVPSFLKVTPSLSPSPARVPILEVEKPTPLRRPSVGIGETIAAGALPLPSVAALPFNPDAAAPVAATSAPATSTSASPPAGGALSTGTALAFVLPRGPDTPFSPAPASARQEQPKSDAQAPAAAARSLPSGTALALDLPRRPAMPFSSVAAGNLDDRSRGAEVAALAHAIVARGLSTAKPASPQTGSPAAPASAPGATPPAAGAPLPIAPTAPQLTLEQHASLCAELVFRPDERAAILARYRVTEETTESLGRQYRSRPDQRAAWDTAHRTYLEWLSSHARARPRT